MARHEGKFITPKIHHPLVMLFHRWVLQEVIAELRVSEH
jgi:hypothetical protein